MQPRVLRYTDSDATLWLGTDNPGMVRKVYKMVYPDMGSEHLVAGVTIFEPGEASSMHVHPDSEEINFVLSGSGTFVTDDGEQAFDSAHVIFVPAGTRHQHRNTGHGPLVLAWAYSPQAELPSA